MLKGRWCVGRILLFAYLDFHGGDIIYGPRKNYFSYIVLYLIRIFPNGDVCFFRSAHKVALTGH